jgi:hypothetical protein
MVQRDPDRDPMDRDILDIIPERFDSDADSRKARSSALSRLLMKLSLMVLMVAALGVAARHILFGDTPHERQLSVPVIHADDKAIKIKPQDRGGMDVPNQDKLIYDKMAANGQDQQPERLLPPPEQAQTPPSVDQRVSTNGKVAASDAMPPAMTAPVESKQGSAPVETKPAPSAMTAATAPMPPAAAPVMAPPPKAPPAPAKIAAPVVAPAVTASPPAPVANKAGGWVVQLGALRSEGEAKTEWTHLKSVHADLLQSLSSDIVRVDLGAKGIYWRVRGGPLDEAQARLLCAQLTKQNQGCIIARK